jgi:hypothetical protein
MTSLRLALYVDFLAWLAAQLETAIGLETALNEPRREAP